MENKVLVDKLISNGFLNQEIGQKLLQEASFAKRPVEDLLYERKIVPEQKLLDTKSQILQIPSKTVDVISISDDLIKAVPETTVRNFRVVPMELKEGLLVVGMVDPDDSKAQDALKFIARQLKVNLGVYLIPMSLWEGVLRRYSPYRSEVEAAVKSISALTGKN